MCSMSLTLEETWRSKVVTTRLAISLYDIYNDEAAFQAHLASIHYVAFVAATAPAVNNKVVRAFALKAN